MTSTVAARARANNGGVLANKVAAQSWTPLHQRVALSSAPRVEEFYRRLVLLAPAGNNLADAFEPLCLFRHFHKSEPEGAATTALLLVTDPRWRDVPIATDWRPKRRNQLVCSAERHSSASRRSSGPRGTGASYRRFNRQKERVAPSAAVPEDPGPPAVDGLPFGDRRVQLENGQVREEPPGRFDRIDDRDIMRAVPAAA